jgi:cytochrome c-type biogenesis protein
MLLGTGRVPFLQRGFHFHVGRIAGRPLSALGLGLAFAFGWSPCIGPILGAILTVAAAVMVAVGVAIMAGELTTFSYGLREAVPALGEIG